MRAEDKQWRRGIGNDCHDVYDGNGRKVCHVYNPADGTMIVDAINAMPEESQPERMCPDCHNEMGMKEGDHCPFCMEIVTAMPEDLPCGCRVGKWDCLEHAMPEESKCICGKEGKHILVDVNCPIHIVPEHLIIAVMPEESDTEPRHHITHCNWTKCHNKYCVACYPEWLDKGGE